jgi:hypothetical protein
LVRFAPAKPIDGLLCLDQEQANNGYGEQDSVIDCPQ